MDPVCASCLQASDEIGSLLVMTLKHKLRSFAFCPTTPKGCTGQLALGLANNSVEVGDVGLMQQRSLMVGMHVCLLDVLPTTSCLPVQMHLVSDGQLGV